MKIKQIQWSEVRQPDDDCCYTHVIGETPFGRFLITWKGWKESPSFDVEESPWDVWVGSGYDLENAKKLAQDYFEKTIMEAIVLS